MITVIFSQDFLKHKPPNFHPENPRRLRIIIDYLESHNIREIASVIEPSIYDENILRLVHEDEYINYVKTLCRSDYQWIDGDTYVCRSTFKVALLAASACINGIDLILSAKARIVFALVRPPGHHAGRNGAAMGAPTLGFCIFNNVAIAAQYCLNKNLRRVLIVDLDAHHGNGTQEIFNYNPNVLYVSLHQDPLTLYPGTGFPYECGEGEGEGYKINIPLPPYTSDDLYLKTIDEIIIPLIEQFKPEICLISAGFDAHASDRLTQLMLSDYGYFLAYVKVIERVLGITKGVLLSLEGGYNNSMPRIIFNILNYFSKGSHEFEERILQTTDSSIIVEYDKLMEDVKRVISKYWSL